MRLRLLLLLACLLGVALLHTRTMATPVRAAGCEQHCTYHLPIVAYNPTPPVTIVDYFVSQGRGGSWSTGGLVRNDLDIPLYDVRVQFEYPSGETATYTSTVPLTLPILLPGALATFGGPGGTSQDFRWPERVRVVSWKLTSPVPYVSLTIVSLETKHYSPPCAGSEAFGLVRNDYPYVVRDIWFELIVESASPSNWWWATHHVNMRSGTGTLQPGQTDSYFLAALYCAGWPPSAKLHVAAQGIAAP